MQTRIWGDPTITLNRLRLEPIEGGLAHFPVSVNDAQK